MNSPAQSAALQMGCLSHLARLSRRSVIDAFAQQGLSRREADLYFLQAPWRPRLEAIRDRAQEEEYLAVSLEPFVAREMATWTRACSIHVIDTRMAAEWFGTDVEPWHVEKHAARGWPPALLAEAVGLLAPPGEPRWSISTREREGRNSRLGTESARCCPDDLHARVAMTPLRAGIVTGADQAAVLAARSDVTARSLEVLAAVRDHSPTPDHPPRPALT